MASELMHITNECEKEGCDRPSVGTVGLICLCVSHFYEEQMKQRKELFDKMVDKTMKEIEKDKKR